MNKKSLSLIVLSTLLVAAFGPIAFAHDAPFPATYDSTLAVVDTIGEPESLDPAWSYDTAGGGVIINVYETMACFDNIMEGNGPYTAGKADQFKPLLAVNWQWMAGPAPYVKTITFAIRAGVTFHDGNPLTPADVEYSWERWLVQDRDGGPQWMFYYPLMGIYGAVDPLTDPNFGNKINDAITTGANTVAIHLMTDYPETQFLQIMSQPWAGVVEKTWAQGRGDLNVETLPGGWNDWAQIYAMWHNPAGSFIEGAMMGTGPYKLDFWARGVTWSIVKYDNYWDGWPARVRRAPAATNERIVDFLTRVTWNLLPNWGLRQARFSAGDSDYTYVPRQFTGAVLGTVVGGESVRCYYPIEPVLALDAFFFNFDINPTSPYLGPGFDPANPLTIAEDRIPTNLFSDINVRRGFTFAFDYATYLVNAYLGEATQPADPVIPGLAYDNPANAKPVFNMVRAQLELQAAFGGALWANGMTMVLLYNSGNRARETAMTMLMNNINILNPKFHLSVQEVAWGSTYLPRMTARMLPLFTNGWTADYPDPDDFVFPFMHSQGTFSKFQSYSNARVDALIKAGALMPEDLAPYAGLLDQPDLASLIAVFNDYPNIPPDTRWPRRSIYYELQALYTEDVPSVCLAQPVGRHWEQAWMRGWYYNPLYGGSFATGIDSTAPEAPVTYFYHIWKAKTHFGDANNDGVVNVLDWGVISASWTKPSPTSPLGPLGYKPQADMTGGTGGIVGFGSGLVVGIPDGKVTVVDAALIGAYWDGPPLGPSHP